MGINKKTKEATSILIKGRAPKPQETIVVKGSQKVNEGLSEKSIVSSQTKETSRTDKYKALLKNQGPVEQKSLTRKEVSQHSQKIRGKLGLRFRKAA